MPARLFTQAIARWVWEQVDADGQHRFDGIRYVSHLDARWICWAAFDARLRLAVPAERTAIGRTDPDMRRVMRIYRLRLTP